MICNDLLNKSCDLFSVVTFCVIEDRSDFLLDFKDLRQRVGFDDYYEISSKYETSKRD